MSRPSQKLLRFLFLIAVTIIFTVVGTIPVRIAITKVQVPEPQAILMLGGSLDRDRATAKFAKKHPNLPVWISAGYSRSREILAKANIDPNRIHYDNRATDTVTNFTTMVQPLKKHEIRHVYLITSDYHMRRSRAIGTIVFGSRGIILTPVTVSSKREPETTVHVARDVGRSLIWLFTGRTGASLNPRLDSVRKQSNPITTGI